MPDDGLFVSGLHDATKKSWIVWNEAGIRSDDDYEKGVDDEGECVDERDDLGDDG